MFIYEWPGLVVYIVSSSDCGVMFACFILCLYILWFMNVCFSDFQVGHRVDLYFCVRRLVKLGYVVGVLVHNTLVFLESREWLEQIQEGWANQCWLA